MVKLYIYQILCTIVTYDPYFKRLLMEVHLIAGNFRIYVNSIATIAVTILFISTVNVRAQDEEEEDTVEILTFPYVVDNENKMSRMPNGYHFELWKQTPGTVRMTIPNDAAKFSVEWSNVNNFVARVGLKYDETEKHDEIGTFTADLAFQGGMQGSGIAYYGIYGWTVDTAGIIDDSTVEYSLVEFYVMENWNNWRPSAGQGDHIGLGEITVDGRQYEVIKRQMQGQPSIKGTANFPQIFSIRKQPSSNGSISISEHFKEWEKLGVELGYMYEVKIKVESYSQDNGSSGSVNVTTGVIKVNGQIPVGTVRKPDMPPHDRYSPATGSDNSPGVYTLYSLTGEKVRSMRLHPSQPAAFSTDNVAPGRYYLHFQGKGSTPTTRPVLVK